MRTTGFIRDTLYHRHNEHDRWHPESPARLDAIERRIDRATWLDGPPLDMTARDAEPDEILYNHSEELLRRVQATANLHNAQLDPDTGASEHSYAAGLRAVGGLLTLADAVMRGDISNGFVALRPPGHHATPGQSMGFCLFNNVAILAHYLKRVHFLSRVAIVDFDVHHGNGTQDSFYDDPSVLFISSHRYPFYPGSGHYEHSGSGEGAGYTINLPLPVSMGDAEYVALYERIVAPALAEYKPEFLIISAGYDAHRDDPLGGMRLTERGYEAITAILLDTVQQEAGHGRVVASLEGGYDITALAHSVLATLKVFKGESDGRAAREESLNQPTLPAFATVFEKLEQAQRRYWRVA